MKISFLLPHIRLSGGVKALMEYANRLQARGHKVKIIVTAPRRKWYRLDQKIQARRAGVRSLSPESVDWLDNKVPILILPENHPRFVPDADIIAASAWQTARFAAGLPPEKGKKFYFVQHYEALWTRNKKQAEQTYRLPLKKIAISTWLKNILWKKYQQEAELFVIPVDPQDFLNEEKRWNVPRRVCMLHHDYQWKGFREGIAAIRKVRSQGHRVELVVFGEKLKDPAPLYAEAGFEFEYHYRPTREALRNLYASCDIFLCPSWYEGLGLPPMEAMACRCALVTTDTGGSRDYALDGETALVSPPKDPEKLAENLIRLLDDESLLRRLAENGHQKIRKLDWNENIRRIEALFQKTASGN